MILVVDIRHESHYSIHFIGTCKEKCPSNQSINMHDSLVKVLMLHGEIPCFACFCWSNFHVFSVNTVGFFPQFSSAASEHVRRTRMT